MCAFCVRKSVRSIIHLSYFTAKLDPDVGFGSGAHDHVWPWPIYPSFQDFFFRVLSHVWKEGAEPEILYDHFQFVMCIILQNEKGIKCAKKIFLCYFFSKIQNPKHVQFFKNILLFSILFPCFAGWSPWISEESRGPIFRSSGVINSSGWS